MKYLCVLALLSSFGCAAATKQELPPPGWCGASFVSDELVLSWCDPTPWERDVDRACQGAITKWAESRDQGHVLFVDTACDGAPPASLQTGQWEYHARQVLGDRLAITVPVDHVGDGESVHIQWQWRGEPVLITLVQKHAQQALAADGAARRR